MAGPMSEVAVEAVAEVGNPTILATFAVIAAVLPMAFVRGLDGAVHAAHSRGRVGGHALLAAGCFCGFALGGPPTCWQAS